MLEITLSGSNWETANDFYAALLPSLGAPDWHGRNLDGLRDSITGGDINAVNPPLTIRISGIDQMSLDCKALVYHFAAMVSEARAEGYVVEVVFL